MKKLYLCLDSYVGLYTTDLWEHDDSRRQIHWSEGQLLCFQYVCRYQADAEQCAEKHKKHTDFSFFLFHFLLVLLKGVGLSRPRQVPLL